MSLVELFRGYGWGRIMLFPILQNEKKKKKDVTVYPATEIFVLLAPK